MSERLRDEKFLRITVRLQDEQRAFVEELARLRACTFAEAVHILIERGRRAGHADLATIRKPQPAVGTGGGRQL